MSPVVFIVEDDSGHIVLMERAILREFPNASMQCFQDAEACLRELVNAAPDIIIADYMMPGMNGLEFLEALNRKGMSIPVVMVTGQGNESVAVQAIKAGAWDYLVKSMGFFELLPCVIDKVLKERSIQDSFRQNEQKMNIRLREYAAQLELRNLELQDFAFAASHDLQEPLRKIQTFGAILQEECKDLLPLKHRDLLQRMIRSADRMRILVQALLSYCRVGAAAESYTRVDLGVVVKDILRNLKGRVDEAGATVEIGDLPSVEGDLGQLQLLLHNLLANALKCVKEGEKPLIKINGRVVESPQSPKCEFVVQDNGIGLSAHGLERAFRPFVRQHGRDEYDGAGMGLAICRRIVARHGGTITATSAPGKGSTFVVTLPYRQVTEGPETLTEGPEK